MEKKKLIVIGVDNGNGSTKTVKTSRFSGVRIVENTLAENILEYEGVRYAVGEKPPAYNSRKYCDEGMYIQTLAAIASELDARNITDDKCSVWVALGLPIGHWSKQKEKIKEYIMKNAKVEFTYNDKFYRVMIEGVNILPQGLASTRSYRQNEKGNIYTLDIGYGTLDYLVFHNGTLSECECGSTEFGVSKAFETVKKAIANEFAEDIDYFSFENYIKEEKKGINPTWHSVIDNAIKGYCKEVINEAKRVGYNPNTYSLHIVGGGANIMSKFADLNEYDLSYDLDVHSNAKGFEWFCKQNLRKQGIDYYE